MLSTGQPIAKAALDMAVHDLNARAVGLPLRCYLGGSPDRATVALSHTVTAHDAAAAADEVAAARVAGFRHHNVKVAVVPETDLAVALAVRAAAGGRPVGQAASLYSFWYYVGSSVGGTVAGAAWDGAGWPAVAALAGGCTVGALLLAVLLGRTHALTPT